MSVSNNHHLDSEHFALGDPKLFFLFLIIGLTPDIICATLGPSLYSQLISSDIMSDKTWYHGIARLIAVPLMVPLYFLSLKACPKSFSSKTNLSKSVLRIAILLPFTIFLGYLYMYIFQFGATIPSQEHPLVLLSRSGNFNDKILVAFLVLAVAPIHEEVLFRGLFQSWILSASCGSCLGLSLASALVFSNQFSRIINLTENRFVLIQILVFLILCFASCRLGKLMSSRMEKIMAAAAVFAAVHSFAWPSPAGLLPLACGLGWIREVSGTVWPGMILHSLFNLTGYLFL